MSRIRSFAAPHKGLRHIMTKFSFVLGHTDFSDPGQLLKLKELGNEMFTLLKDHTHTENTHTLKRLEEKAKGAADHDRSDHEKLEKIQDELEIRLMHFSTSASSDEAHGFYLEFSRFYSLYLEHIYEEETVTELLLQQHFTDEELLGHRISIMQGISFPVLLLWLKYIVPAQNETENKNMLNGFKAQAPAAAFEEVLDTIKNEMSAERYGSLISKIL